VHLYWAKLDEAIDDATAAHLCGSLAWDELERARRFKFMLDTQRYMRCRGLLRALVGAYAGRPPSAVVFTYASAGKPRLASNHYNLCFNVSHTEGTAVLAFARSEVGVDIENIHAAEIAEEVAELFAGKDEFGHISELPANERQKAVLQLWTRKEALLKAAGTGMIADLCSVQAGIRSTIVTARLPCSMQDDWAVEDIERAPDIVGAIAYPRGTQDRWMRRDFQVSLRSLEFRAP
jgi:phosphopantetheinyl transferase